MSDSYRRANGGWGKAVIPIAAVCAFMLPAVSRAITFEYDYFGGIIGTLNTEFSAGGQWRLQDRDADLIGKANINPAVCRSTCQPHLSTPPGAVPGRFQLGLDGEGPFVNQLGLDAPGAGGVNNDDGNLNFDKYDITQGLVQIKQDLTLEWEDWIFFGRYQAFHDFVNYNRDIYHPNLFLPEDRVESELRHSDGNPAAPPGGQFGEPAVGTRTFRQVDNDYNDLLGQRIQILDFFVQGPVKVPFTEDFKVQLTVGEQIINWGENTVLAVNSLNSINPPNINALFRPAFLSLAAVFEPIGAIKVAAPLTLNTSFEAFYQYDWEKVEIPPRGAFLSFIDVTLGDSENLLNPGFGQAPEDRDGNYRAEQQLLTAIADVQGNVPIFERNAPSKNQYGLAYTWFLPRFNNGTELRFYYARYNSRLPYFSAIAGQESCLQSMPDGFRPTGPSDDLAQLAEDCPQQDLGQFSGAVAQELGGERAGEMAFIAGRAEGDPDGDGFVDPATGGQGYNCGPNRPGTGPCAEAYVLDSFAGLLEYPESIQMYGISFNTSFGDISFQGEVAYRPNLPLQVDDVDVAFTALQPTAPLGCSGVNQSADCVPGSTDDIYFIGGNIGASGALDLLTTSIPGVGGLLGAPEGANVLLSDAPGRAVAFPSFLSAYRGLAPGEIQGSLPANPETGEPGRPGDYIRGYERFQVFQYNLGATYVLGPGNWVRANQIIFLFELGATHVLGLPDKSELQIEGPGTFYHASVGTNGSGAPACAPGVVQGDAADPNSSTARQASTTICGQFQPRFNPEQQSDGFADDFSAGTRVIAIVRYENVLPGISFEPTIVLGYDFHGTAPGPGENFIEGRQIYVVNVEMRYQQRWSMTVGFTVFRGAEPFNLFADRDFFQLGIRYRF